jgi:hypothetical protein
MSYYPKSQIKTNLYTNGNDFLLSSNQENYSGHYYETSNGSKFTGKFPGDGNNTLLLSFSLPKENSELFPESDLINLITLNPPVETLSNSPVYSSDYVPSQNPNLRSIPSFHYPKPTPQEIQQGAITRYFCKKNNEYKYIEINKDTFNKLQSQDKSIAWDLYTPTSLTYYITTKSFYPPTSNIENQLGWNGFSQYARPLKA